MLSLLRNKSGEKAGGGGQVRHLSPQLTFVDVVRACCARGGRFTLKAESQGATFTVLVDRGGPFNASGDSLSGSEALVAAAALHSGTYTIIDGWPVAQPLYQIGLDATLRMLAKDAAPLVVGELPPARGVDALRSPVNRGAAAALQSIRPTFPATPAAAPAPAPAAPMAATPPAPAAVVAPPPAPAPALPAPPQYVPTPQPVPRPLPSATAAVPTPPPVPALMNDVIPPRPQELMEADAITPGAPTASIDQGSFKHLVTQSLLWLVQIEEPQRYTLPQALTLVTRALLESLRTLVHPFSRSVERRWQQTKKDWETSGEVVAKQKARQQRRTRDIDVDPRSGPFSGV